MQEHHGAPYMTPLMQQPGHALHTVAMEHMNIQGEVMLVMLVKLFHEPTVDGLDGDSDIFIKIFYNLLGL